MPPFQRIVRQLAVAKRLQHAVWYSTGLSSLITIP